MPDETVDLAALDDDLVREWVACCVCDGRGIDPDIGGTCMCCHGKGGRYEWVPWDDYRYEEAEP